MRTLLIAVATAMLAMSQPRTFPVVTLTVEGNKHFSAEQILRLADIRIGQPADQKAFEAARDRLTNSGFFETVGYKYGPSADKTGYSATFMVQEVQQAYAVRFDRMPKSDDELRAVLAKADPLFGPKVPGTQQLLKRYAAFLEENLKEKVVGRVLPDPDKNELTIVFQPATLPPVIAEVTFTKNEVIPLTALQNAIAGAAVGSVWAEKRFREMLDASIRPLYEARGRIRVSFPKVSVEPVKDVTGLRVTAEVSEGEVYKLGEVVIPGDKGRELSRAADLKPDDIANFDEINKGMERVREPLRRTGYLNAKVTAARRIDDKAKVVALDVKIDRGQRYTLGKMTIVGLDIITEPHIRKMWGAKEGEPFNPEYPQHFLNRVREEGVLEGLGKTKADVKTDDKTFTADVTLHFLGEDADGIADGGPGGLGGGERRRPTRRRRP